jgi:hypothetical protein
VIHPSGSDDGTSRTAPRSGTPSRHRAVLAELRDAPAGPPDLAAAGLLLGPELDPRRITRGRTRGVSSNCALRLPRASLPDPAMRFKQHRNLHGRFLECLRRREVPLPPQRHLDSSTRNVNASACSRCLDRASSPERLRG